MSQLTAFILPAARISSYSCAFMVCNTFRSVQFSSRYLPCCRPVSGGACGCSSGGISQVIGTFSGIRLGRGAHIQPGTQRLSFMWNSDVQPHRLSSSSPRPVQHRTVGLIQGCDNLRLFQVSEEVCFVGCHQSRMWNPIAVSSGSSDCVTCDHTRGSERRGCCTQCETEHG